MKHWLDAGALRRHRGSRREVADLLAVVERDLADARVTALSLDRRFATAYSAALQLATIVLAGSGFRTTAQRGHHAVTWQALPELMGASIDGTAVYFDSCRTLRNRSDYDRVGVVSEAEVEEALRETEVFRGQVIDWLAQEHGWPELIVNVLRDIRSRYGGVREGVDRLVFAGDFLDRGPRAQECLDLIEALAGEVLWGNHDLAIAVGYEIRDQGPESRRLQLELRERLSSGSVPAEGRSGSW